MFSFINVFGLAIGISASLVIYMIVSYEFSYDTYEKDNHRIYRVVTAMMFPDNPYKTGGVPVPLAAAAKKDISGIETAAPFYEYGADVTMPGKAAPVKFKNQEKIVFADDNYFKLFAYTWVNGNAAVLNKPFTVVLTESRAKQYFGTAEANNIIGKTITYADSIKATVSGIVKDNNEVSDLTYKEFISISTIPNLSPGLKENFSWDEWGSINSAMHFFVKLKDGANVAQVEKQVQSLQNKNSDAAKLKVLHSLQALTDIHFDTEYDNYSERQSQRTVMYGLLAVAAFLLLLGCINFINLTTSQATQRAKEIGIRKAMGSTKRQLVFQFLTETFVLTLAASILSVIVTPALLSVFATYIPQGVSFNMITQPHVIAFMVLLIITVSVLSGFYPAMVLSQFKPVAVLKNQVVSIGGAVSRRAVLRKSLTVGQFVIAQFFIIGTVVVSKQIHYALNADLGYKKDAIITIETPWNEDNNKRVVLLNKIRAIPEVQDAALGGNAPASNGMSKSTLSFAKDKKDIETTVEMKYADSAYFGIYKMKLVAGRYLRRGDSASGYLINNACARVFGFANPADAIGQNINRGDKKMAIVGVLADIHTKSMHTLIQPLVYAVREDNYSTMHLALQPRNGDGGNWKRAIAKMGTAWKQVYPDEDFNYQFFDETIAKFYASEQSTSTLLTWATGLAIFISCLGLLGLAIYTTNQRTKEIGVRKVLGASVQQIVLLLSKDFVQLIILAFVIAVPLAWWAMHAWLQSYPYHTALSWWVFAVSGIVLIVVAFIVLGLRTVKAASQNPVKALKRE